MKESEKSDDVSPSSQAVSWTVQSIPEPTTPDCALVRKWLREHNTETNPEFMRLVQRPENDAQPLILLADTGTEVIGGLFSVTQFAWLRISIMAVNPDYRRRGVGTTLLAEAERIAKKRGCQNVYVDTMEYQGPEFYRSHGFHVVGEIPDWDSHGHAKYFLTKSLYVAPQTT